jgi:hypothetical protein
MKATSTRGRIQWSWLLLGLISIAAGLALVYCKPAHAQRVVWGGDVDINAGQGRPLYSYYPQGQQPGAPYLIVGGTVMAGGAFAPQPYGTVITRVGGAISAIGAVKQLTAPPTFGTRPAPAPVAPAFGGDSSPPPSGDVADNKDAFRVRVVSRGRALH